MTRMPFRTEPIEADDRYSTRLPVKTAIFILFARVYFFWRSKDCKREGSLLVPHCQLSVVRGSRDSGGGRKRALTTDHLLSQSLDPHATRGRRTQQILLFTRSY